MGLVMFLRNTHEKRQFASYKEVYSNQIYGHNF